MLNILQGVLSSLIATFFVDMWNFGKKDQISEKQIDDVETENNSRVFIDQTHPDHGTVKKTVGKIKTGTGSPVTIKQ